MNTTFLTIFYFVLTLVLMGLSAKYILKLDTNILFPSAIMFLLFVITTICSHFTLKKYETTLFTIFCGLELVTLIVAILLMSKQKILWKHFFISLPLQLFYWAILLYYGGLQFTHKFGV